MHTDTHRDEKNDYFFSLGDAFTPIRSGKNMGASVKVKKKVKKFKSSAFVVPCTPKFLHLHFQIKYSYALATSLDKKGIEWGYHYHQNFNFSVTEPILLLPELAVGKRSCSPTLDRCPGHWF